MSKEIKKITADEVYPVSMKRLADRPNSSSAQGRGGMSAAELKGFMDKYPALVKERLNELIELINAGSADGLTTVLKAPVVDETTGKEISLYEWIVQAGKTHESLQAEIGKKLNKVTEIPDGNKRYVYLIAKVNGEVGVYLYEAAVTNENGAFVVRNPAGNIFITQAHVSAPPVDGDNIATKDYVDKNVSSTAYIDAGLEKKVDKIVPASAYAGRRLYAATKKFGITVTNASYSYIKVNGASVDGSYQLKDGDVITITTFCWLKINGTEYRSDTTLNLADTDITVGTTTCLINSSPITVTINFSVTGKAHQYGVEYTSGSAADTIVSRDANRDSGFNHVILYGTPTNEKHAVPLKHMNAELDKKLDKTGGTVTGDLTIEKNLVVKGKTQTVDAETLKVKDKLIIVASGNTVPLTSPAGLLAPKYDGEHYGALVFDSTGTAMVGDVSLDEDGNISSVNDLQPLATRGDISDGNLVKWDQTKQTLVGAGASSVNPTGNTFAQRDESGTLYGESGSDDKALVNLQQMTAAISAATTTAPIDVTSMHIQGIDIVSYDTVNGAEINYLDASIKSENPNTHEIVTDDIPYTTIQLPIKPGKYINIDADSSNTAIEVKVDDTELAKDYVKAPTSTIDVAPVYDYATKTVIWRTATPAANSNSVVLRDANADSKFGKVYCNEILRLSDGYQAGTTNQLRFAVTTNADMTVAKTSTNTGTMTADNLNLLQQFTQMHIVYDNQLYYRMDPLAAPDGTLNFIHIDSIQDNGSYKATGKCFSITVSTRAWQVVDIKFGSDVAGSNETYVNTVGLYSSGNVQMYIMLTAPLPIDKSTFFDKFSGCRVIGTWKNLAETGSEMKSAVILISTIGDKVTVQAGDSTYTYTANQLTVSVSTHKVSL